MFIEALAEKKGHQLANVRNACKEREPGMKGGGQSLCTIYIRIADLLFFLEVGCY